MSYNSCLLGVPIFKDLDVKDLEKITQLIEPVNLVKNESLFQAGDDLNHLYILHRGSLKVYGLAENGKSHVLRLLNEGDFIGEHALLQAQESEVSVDALSPSHVCMIKGPQFAKLLEDTPELSMKIIQALLNRLQDSDQRSTANLTLSARERLLQALESMKDSNNTVTLDVSKREFASVLGMAQETLSRQFTNLEDEGLIKLKGQRTIILL
ncbi:MAG: Crp/Fnr family transcriptional regulator [Erysipelothrix sp.]|nr:Crp/Fnr family transcriptional regulator [Erysipelothrix sp.]